ncbi:MAG: flippase-like domain-containing protein [Kiloniellaceae bacterium]
MTSTGTHAGHRLLVRWVGLVQRWAVLVLVLAVLATAGAAYVTVSGIGINTSTTDMLSAGLAFRRNAEALKQAFPQFTDTLTVVIEADTPDRAEAAAELLSAELHARPGLYRSVFYPEGDPFFRRNGLLYLELDELQALSDRLAEAQPLLAALSEDMSLRGLAKVLRLAVGDASQAEGGGDPGKAVGDAAAAVAPVLDRIAVTVESVAGDTGAEGRPRALSWGALLRGEDPGPEDRRRLIAAQPVLDYGSLEPAAAAIETVRRLAGELELTEAKGLQVRMTGTAMMFQDELRSVREGVGLAGLLSAFLVSGLLMIGLRSPRLVVATLAALVMGLIWTAAFATAVIGELNLISVAFAVLFIGLSVDFGIHYALRYKEAVDAGATGGKAQGAALDQAAQGVGGTLTLCAVAAAIGFFSFLPTAYRGVSELGLISGAGMFIALFANLTVLPAVLSLLPLKARRPAARSQAGDRVQRVVARHHRAVIGAALGLGLLAALAVPFAWFDDDPLNLRDPESESVVTLTALLDDSRVEPYSASVLAEDLAAAEGLAAELEQLPEVADAVTLHDLIPTQQEQKLAIIDQMGFFLTPILLPARRAALPSPEEQRQAMAALATSLAGVGAGPLAEGARRLAAALLRLDFTEATLARLDEALLGGLPRRLYALSEGLEAAQVTLEDLPDEVRDRRLAADGRARIEVIPGADLRDPTARRRFVDAVRTVAPAASDTPVTITEAGRAVVRAFGAAAGYALALITLLLLTVLRSLRDTLMVLAPLVLAALMTLAATVVFQRPFNFANVIVLPLLFGLGVAGGIHIVARARGPGAAAAMATSTPRAVLFSALTTIGSFCALALSSHRGTASMGALLTIAITLTMFSTLIVLPALMAAVAERSRVLEFRKRRPGPRLLRVVTLAPGLGLLGFVASRIDLAEVGRGVLELGISGAFVVVAVYFLVFLVDTASWRLMLPSVPLNLAWLYRMWKVRMVGEAFNLVVPAGSMGGEPVKAVLLKRTFGIDYREAGASLVMAKTVNLLALLVFAGIGFVLMLRAEALAESYRLVAGIGLAALSSAVLGFFAVQRWGAASRLGRLLARRPAGRLARGLEHVRAIDDRFHEFYVRRPGRFAAASALGMVGWLLGAGELYLIMVFLGQPVSLAEAWLIETVAQLVRAGAFFIPAGLGATEAALVVIYGALTGQPALGLVVAVIRRARELLWIAWGFWLGWRFSLTPAAVIRASGGTAKDGPDRC